jgi:hypothetical protein
MRVFSVKRNGEGSGLLGIFGTNGFAKMSFKPMWAIWLAVLWVICQTLVERVVLPFERVTAEELIRGKANPMPVPFIRNAAVTALAFSPDANTIASGEYSICLHDIATGQNLCESETYFNLGESCRCLEFSPDGRRLVAVYKGRFIGDPDFIIVLWDVTLERKLRNSRTLLARAHGDSEVPSAVHRVSFSPDGKSLIAGSPDGTIFLWEALTGQKRLDFKGGVTAGFAPDGRTLVSVSHDGTIRHRQVATGDLIDLGKRIAKGDFIYVQEAAFAPNGKRLAVCDEYTLCLKDTETGATLRRLEFQGNFVDSLAFSPDSKTLAVGTGNLIRFVNATTGRELCCWKTSRERTGSLAFSCDGKFVAWGEEKLIMIQELAALLRAGERTTPQAKTEPGGVPLQAQLIAIQDTYEFNLDGRTAEEFSNLLGSGDFPPSPQVSLILKLCNSSNQKVTIRNPESELESLYLFGPGAINLPLASRQTAVNSVPVPKLVTLLPGESYSFPVRLLKGSADFSRYWLLPGKYTVRANYFCTISPAPKGARDATDGFGFVWIWSSPLELGVVQTKR